MKIHLHKCGLLKDAGLKHKIPLQGRLPTSSTGNWQEGQHPTTLTSKQTMEILMLTPRNASTEQLNAKPSLICYVNPVLNPNAKFSKQNRWRCHTFSCTRDALSMAAYRELHYSTCPAEQHHTKSCTPCCIGNYSLYPPAELHLSHCVFLDK